MFSQGCRAFCSHCSGISVLTLKKAEELLEWKLLLYMGYSCSLCVIYASSNLLSIFPNKLRLRSYGNRNESVSIRSGWASQLLYENIGAIFLFLSKSPFQDANLNTVLVCPSMPHVYPFINRTISTRLFKLNCFVSNVN